MALTSVQKVILKTAINADATMSAYPLTTDGYIDLAGYLNQQASPTFTVWKTSVPLSEVGQNFNGTELAGLTSGNNSRLQTVGVYFSDGVNPSKPDVRDFFDDIFSGAGGTNTRANLLVLWKRLATRAEKIFATGTGSDAAPATMAVEGAISWQDVQTARNS